MPVIDACWDSHPVREHHYPVALGSVRRARADATGFLLSVNCAAEAIDETALVVGELATNVVLHAPEAPYRLWIGWGGTHLLIGCQDSAWRRLPHLHRPDVDRPFGRGLQLVGALAEEWRVTVDPERRRKTVWARLPASTRAPSGASRR